MDDVSVVDTNIENISQFGVCGYKDIDKDGFREKFGWLKKRFSEGLIIKTLVSEKDGTQGMIEYIPGQYCWRPVDARNYMFIHCIFIGFKNVYKNRGFASLVLTECEKDTRQQKLNGIAVTTRKGSFMAGKEFFIKNGFVAVDSAKPDFELLVKKYDQDAHPPQFSNSVHTMPKKYKNGLIIIRADQCPYTVKNVKEMVEVAKNDYHIEPKVVSLKSHTEAQNSPCPFGTFCIIYNGDIIAHHPISKGRFVNIMKKIESK